MKRMLLKFKIFFNKFFVCVGSISAIITIIGSIWYSKIYRLMDEYQNYKIHLLLSIIIMCALCAFYSIKKKNKISLKISKNTGVDIYYGDLFESNKIIVIPVNDYFDIIVDDKVVSSNTLHGKFIQKYFPNNEKQLKVLINKSLLKIDHIETNKTRAKGNKKRYELGTVAIVEANEKLFYLVAFTKFNQNNRATIKKSEYLKVITKLFEFIEQNSQGFKTNIPLIGAGHSGVELSKQKLLEFLLFSVILSDKLTLINGLDIILNKNIKNKIDLNKIEYYYNMTKE
jgi:hypothetical protein